MSGALQLIQLRQWNAVPARRAWRRGNASLPLLTPPCALPYHVLVHKTHLRGRASAARCNDDDDDTTTTDGGGGWEDEVKAVQSVQKAFKDLARY